MFFTPSPFGKTILEPAVLKEDRKNCLKAGPCGMGRKALYLNSFYISRRYYVVYSDIRRVFKRIAMSSGGFTGKGIFGAIPYLVVVLKDGREKQCNFRIEEDVDAVLKWLSGNHPEIPLVTEKAEKAVGKEKGHLQKNIPKEVQYEIDCLERDITYLEKRPEVYRRLSASVRQKRRVDQRPKSNLILVSAIAAAGLAGLLTGVFFLTNGRPYAPYLLLFGASFLFLALATGTLPIGANSRKAVKKSWENALSESEEYISGRPDFFLPPQYAHPVVCRRMIRVLESGQAATRREALEKVKSDLRELNSSVKVSQAEYDEVVQVKPLFLECGYRDSL